MPSKCSRASRAFFSMVARRLALRSTAMSTSLSRVVHRAASSVEHQRFDSERLEYAGKLPAVRHSDGRDALRECADARMHASTDEDIAQADDVLRFIGMERRR